MLAALLFGVGMIAQENVPPVPGLCSAPVPADRETVGCYETGSIDIVDDGSDLYWHIYQFPTDAAAKAEAERHRWAAATQAHGRAWLYVLGGPAETVATGIERAVIGPLHLPARETTAHFSEAIFPPGMRTRVHSHPGPEAFYVVAGEQCMETPTDRQIVPAGGTYVVEKGPHVQAAPKGRRNLLLILAPKGTAAVIPGGAWQPSGFCDK